MLQPEQCRVWLPRQLCCYAHPCKWVLVGWVNWSRQCLDLVIAAACPLELGDSQSAPALQETSLEAVWKLLTDGSRVGKAVFLGEMVPANHVLDSGFARVSGRNSVWAKIVVGSEECEHHGIWALPALQMLHIDGAICKTDVHMILYEQPRFGSHHFCCERWSYLASVEPSISQKGAKKPAPTKPCWVLVLEQQQDAPDMDLLLLQLNCSAFIDKAITAPGKLPNKVSASWTVLDLWYFSAALLASLATAYFFFAKACSFIGTRLSAWPCANFFSSSHTYSNLRYRCDQLKAWPVKLLWGGSGPNLPDISVAHRLALGKYATIAAVCMDVVLGAAAGILLLLYQVPIEEFVFSMARFLTDEILRTGCIWLMGVPAGFKLNTELTGLFGTISLHVTHTWSTICYMLAPLFGISMRIAAMAGILLGITIHAAIVLDILSVLTLHLSMLHQVLAFLYFNQIRSLASLLRLFRGRKHNPLRGRLDSFDCTAEQIVVASLMFTPLLLLLPTTSGFYMFFTIIHVSLAMISFTLQLAIEFIHTFPYVEVAVWFVHPRRFPSGIRFQTMVPHKPESSLPKPVNMPVKPILGIGDLFLPTSNKSCSVVSDDSRQAFPRLMTQLGDEPATAGDLLMPFWKHLLGGFTFLTLSGHIYKTVGGGRLPSTLTFEACPKLPQPTMALGMFWRLSFQAVMGATVTDGI